MSRKRNTVQREPLRLWGLVGPDSKLVGFDDGHPGVFGSPDAAEVFRETDSLVVEFIEVRQPPPRATEHGPGQHDYVQLGPGVQASLRITKDGRVKLTIPGGELDVTDGSAMLGSGLHEAGARAAQIRARIEERRRKREERKAKP